MVLILALTSSAFYFNWSHKEVRLVALKTEIKNELEEQSLKLKQFEQEKLLNFNPREMYAEIKDLYSIELRYFEKLPLNFISTPLGDSDFPHEKSFDVVPLFLHNFFIPKTIPRSQLQSKIENISNLIEEKNYGKALNLLRQVLIQRVYNKERAAHQIECGLKYLQYSNEENQIFEIVLFYLLYHNQNSYLSEQEITSYREQFKGILGDSYNMKLKQTQKIWNESNKIKEILKNKEKPFYTMLNDRQLLTYSKNNMIAISDLSDVENLFKNKEVGISITPKKPDELPDFMYTLSLPGLYLTASKERFAMRTELIKRDYWALNLVIFLFLSAGFFIVSRAYKAIVHEKNLAEIKSKFVATVSHELRTPLSLIQLYSETLHHGRIDPSQKETYQNTILAELHRINSMVNNIVEHSKFENANQQIHLKEQNLTQCCQEVIQVFQYRLQMENFELKANLEDQVICNFDWQSMTQILYNLIDNAIKYSGTQKIIEIELKQTNRKIYLEISDHGIGIPKENREHIFEEYFRVDHDHVFAQRGTGIGLSLVHKMVDSNGGRIQVSDHYPEGTTFKLTFPNPCHENS